MKNSKEFDCVEMMHRGAERVREETKGMSIEEELAYWRKLTAELRKMQEEIRQKKAS